MPLLLDNDGGVKPLPLPVWIGLGIINFLGFILMGIDKWKAKKRSKRRVRERTFLLIATLFGACGVYLGLKCFRHKTLHRSFTMTLPLLILIQVSMVTLFLYKKILL